MTTNDGTESCIAGLVV